MRVMITMIFVFYSLATFGQGDALQKYQWENRLLLVFAPDKDDQLYQDQRSAIDGAVAGYQDRDLLIVECFQRAAYIQSPTNEMLHTVPHTPLRNYYEIQPEDFQVLLIGKDGGEKLRVAGKVLRGAQPFATIDAMPMRQREMRNDN